MIGNIDLDKTFEERGEINLPAPIKNALEKQVRAEREHRAAFEKVAKESTTMLLPNGLSDIGAAVAGLQKVLKTVEKTPG